MPPRFAYWTLLIDNGPTAFRARDAADLLPTLNQLKRKNPNVVLKWFSGGQLWESPEAATEARRRRPAPAVEKRGPAWRPGGKHADPRDRFRKKKEGARAERPVSSSRRPLPRAEQAARPVSSTRRPLPREERATRPLSSTRRPLPRGPLPRRSGPPKGRGGPRRTK
jgi:hypothetical protein